MPKVTSLWRRHRQQQALLDHQVEGRNANPFGPVDPTTYHDYDEAMQDGVELEEKGERFQFGSKAQRFYVQAGTLYDRAAQLAGANGRSTCRRLVQFIEDPLSIGIPIRFTNR